MRSPFSLVGQSKQKQINESWIVRASLMVRVLREGMPWSEAHIPLTSLTKLAFIFFSFLVFWGWIQIFINGHCVVHKPLNPPPESWPPLIFFMMCML